MTKPFILTAAGNPENQDRGLVLFEGGRLVLCVADGAGGRSGAAEAAVMVTNFVQEHVTLTATTELCSELLRRMDIAVTKDPVAGESTCSLAIVTPTEIFGASVGDSGAWLIPASGTHVDLTDGQQRKPVIGTGSAWPYPFRYPRQNGRLLLATDGLLKYTSAERIVETCRQGTAEVAAQRLIELVRYPSGALPDDVTVIMTDL